MYIEKVNSLANSKKPELIKKFTEEVEGRLLPLIVDNLELLDEFFYFDNAEEKLDLIKEELAKAQEKSLESLKVALIGDYSSGKTTALAALFNATRELSSLPRDLETPTTGNVLELEVVFESKEIQNQFQCILFSSDELEKMIAEYYKELKGQHFSLRNKLPDISANWLDQIYDILENIRSIVNGSLNDLEQKAKNSLIDFYQIVFSLYRFQKKYGNDFSILDNTTLRKLWFPRNHDRFEILLENIVSLDSRPDINKVEDLLGNYWDAVPNDFDKYHTACRNGTISVEALRAIFLLIKRVIFPINIKSQNELIQVNQISFLDFPGLGSTNMRDRWLCQNEVRSAHANLLFIYASKPVSATSPDLYDIIADEKKELVNERIIPVISFFDAYSRIPQYEDGYVTNDANESLAIIRNFFSTKKHSESLINKGFDQFEIVLQNLNLLDKRKGYSLLSAIAAIQDEDLTEGERNFKRQYETKIFPIYRHFLRDLEKVLRTSDLIDSDEKLKYRRLKDALKSYVSEEKDGGVTELKRILFGVLQKEGLQMIAADAAKSLRSCLSLIDDSFVQKLKEEVPDDDEPEDEVRKRIAKDKIVQEWFNVKNIFAEWAKPKGIIELELKDNSKSLTTVENTSSSYEYVSLLHIGWEFILKEVVSLPFWQETITDNFETKEIHLESLIKPYNELLDKVEDWMFSNLSQAIEDTLEKTENTRIIMLDGEVSLKSKIDFFNSLRLESNQQISDIDKATLKDLITFTSLKEYIFNKLIEKYKNNRKTELQNIKTPFDELGVIDCTAIEMMKIQRQMALSLQNKLAELASFFNANFDPEFKIAIKLRLESPENISDVKSYKKFIHYGEIFDRIVELNDQEISPVSSPYLKKKEAEAVAQEFLSHWNDLIN